MKVQHRIVAATALSLALVVNGASTTAFAGGAKPARLVIGAGASALYWSNPMPLGTGTRYGTVKITSGVVIARVRQLINAIPVSDYGANQICPMDVMVPVVIRFRDRPPSRRSPLSSSNWVVARRRRSTNTASPNTRRSAGGRSRNSTPQ